MTHCNRTIGYFENQHTGERVPARCNTWGCEHCGEIKKKRLLDDVSYGGGIIQTNGKRWRFLTLTLSPQADQDQLSKYWNRFRATIRKHGYRPDFFKVTEFTEAGVRHLHVIISVFIPWNLIKSAWYLATDKTSYIVFIKKSQVKSAAGYMAKYMTKQSVLSNLFRKYERRYTFSRSFPRLHVPGPVDEWRFILKPDNRQLLKDAMDYLTSVKRQASAQCLQKVEQS